MLEAEMDAAYSDEEFGSDHEYDGGDDDFAGEDAIVAEFQQIPKAEIPTELNVEEKDAEEYGGEFYVDEEEAAAPGPMLKTEEQELDPFPTDVNPADEDQYDEEYGDDDTAAVAVNSSTLENDGALIDSTSVDGAAKVLTDDATYDGDFGEEELMVGTGVPAVDNNHDTAMEHTTTDTIASVPHDNKETAVLLVHDSTGVNNDNEEEYSNDEEQDLTVTAPVTNLLPEDSGTETVTQRRSSVPSPGIALLSEGSRVVRAGSLPMVLTGIPLDKWMTTIPQEVSSKKHNRSRKPSACFPVQEETPQQNVIDDEDKDSDADDTNFTPSARERAQSFRDLQCEKVTIPLRRAQSLLYTGSLPRVEEVRAAEETGDAVRNSEDEEDYSEDESSDGKDSFESDHDSDESTAGSPSNGPNSTTALDSREGDHPATISTFPTDLSIANDQDPLNGSNNNNDSVGKTEGEFPSGPITPHYEGEDIIDKSTDYDVDEFVEDERHEKETQLNLPQTEINATECSSDQPPVIPNSTAMDDSPETIPVQPSEEKKKQSGSDKREPLYDGDDEFIDSDAEAPTNEAPEQDERGDRNGSELYEQEADDFEDHDVAVGVVNLENEKNSIEVKEDAQPATGVGCTNNDKTKTEQQEAETAVLSRQNSPIMPGEVSNQPLDASQRLESSSAEVPTEQDPKNTPATSTSNVSPEPSRPDKMKVVSLPVRPRQLVKKVDSPANQPTQLMNPSRPPTKRTAPTPAPPSSASTYTTTTPPRSSRNKLKNATSDCQIQTSSPSACANTAAESEPTTPIRQRKPPKTSQKVSSLRSPWACSGPYQYISNDYPQMPRKEPVPRQKAGSKPSTSRGSKRRLLQPPVNVRFDTPKMDKTNRDWLFVNMFRRDDDLSKYEPFMPSTLLARPPATMETKICPLTGRQVYGGPHSSRFVSSVRKLVPQPSLEIQNRERNWVSTTPHDSKLPQYDSILDKHCTTVTSPMVQRQIYQTRHRDLSPQLAYVLEKRVEKHYRQGFYDSFGGVSSSYKTEIVPTSPRDGTRLRQLSPRFQFKSGVLERQMSTSVASEEE